MRERPQWPEEGEDSSPEAFFNHLSQELPWQREAMEELSRRIRADLNTMSGSRLVSEKDNIAGLHADMLRLHKLLQTADALDRGYPVLAMLNEFCDDMHNECDELLELLSKEIKKRANQNIAKLNSWRVRS